VDRSVVVMMDEALFNIPAVYLKVVDGVVIDRLLRQLDVDESHINFDTSKTLIEKWSKECKVFRTEYAWKAIPIHPTNTLPLSVLLDAILNILDDLSNKQNVDVYAIELAKLISLLCLQDNFYKHRNRISEYFQKILCVKGLEAVYYDAIRQSKSFDYKLFFTIKCYSLKSMDVDIFFELPLTDLSLETGVEWVVKLARMFRAIDMIKRDSEAFYSDFQNQIDTPLVIACRQYDLNKFIQSMYEHYLSEVLKISKKIDFNHAAAEICERLEDMILSRLNSP